MSRGATAFVSGVLFAIGLAVSGMTRPAKVIGFLDLAGQWDPSLAWVMAGAIAVYATAYWFSRRMTKPIHAKSFTLPARGTVDAKLIAGSLVFGAGWGLAGFCPGPAIVSAASGASQSVAFCVAMAFGFWVTRAIDGRNQRPATRASALG